MKFHELAVLFDEIEQQSSRLKITELLAQIFKKTTPREAAIIAYLSLGSLNPPYLGMQFNFAEKSLIKALALLLDMAPDAVRKKAHTLGDLGLVVQDAKRKGTGILSITDVNKILHQFSEISGNGAQELKEEKIIKLLSVLDGTSGKYVVRIIQGALRMGFSDMTLLDAFSWMVCGNKSMRAQLEDAYNVCADIGLIIKTLKEEGLQGITTLGIIPGIPVRPAGAERLASPEDIFDKLGPCIGQPKLDGFRVQVHVDHSHTTPLVRFFSRNLLDMSAMFPDLAAVVNKLKVTSVVLEGEAIAYDVETGSFLPFQETVKRKRKYDIDKMAADYPLKLYLFDLLYLNGKSYLDVAHHERRERLCTLVEEKAGAVHEVVKVIEENKLRTAQEIKLYFEQNITQGLEGIVVKRDDAVYQAGKRNFNWIKLKRHESGELDDTLDCVILGYYFGHGKRASFGIGALLVGLYNKEKDCFQTVAKIGTGLTDEEWRAQKKACDNTQVSQRPANVACAKELYPDVWVLPETVCLIRADEITRSPLHTAGATEKELGYALRFPRLMGYRPDKQAYDATTVKELLQLYTLQFNKK